MNKKTYTGYIGLIIGFLTVVFLFVFLIIPFYDDHVKPEFSGYDIAQWCCKMNQTYTKEGENCSFYINNWKRGIC